MGDSDKTPEIAASEAEADDFLDNLSNQFKPENPVGIVPPSNHWRPQPVVAETEESQYDESDDDSFSWLDFDPKATSCVADGGPAAGKMCNFPFRYQGKTYYECAPLEG